MSRLLRSLALLSALSLLVTSAGCTDVPSAHHVKPPARGEQDYQPPTLPPPVPEAERFELTIVGESALSALVGESLALEVMLVSSLSEQGVAEELVKFEIISQPVGATNSLRTARSLTSNTGLAVNRLQTSSEGQLVVRASHALAESVDFNVDVLALPAGDLRVAVNNLRPEVMSLHTIDVRIYPANAFDCTMFRALGLQEVAFDEVMLATSDDTADFQGLDTRGLYTLTAVALGNRDQVAAGGCLGAVVLEPGELTEVVIDLALLALIPTGNYDVISYWDMTRALAESGPLGAALVNLFAYFDNPGLALYNEMIRQLQTWVGNTGAMTLAFFMMISGLDVTLQNYVNDMIDQSPVLSSIRRAGLDLRDAVSNLEVDSILSVSKLAADNELHGRDEWYGLTFYWRANCDGNSPPDCGRHRIGVGVDTMMGILGADWTGRVIGHDVLEIDSHMMRIRYGRLIIYMLNNVILPGMTNGQAHSLNEAFAYWVGCDRLAQSIAPNGQICVSGFCLPVGNIETMCLAAVNTVFSIVDLTVSSLDYPIDFHIAGRGHLFELDSDAVADVIEDGVFTGQIQTPNGSGTPSPVSAVWSGARVQ